ncbi:MAG: protein kinase [Planctomycetes bacterium]|nr:protein kinase [Planctomycetota bacterium]
METSLPSTSLLGRGLSRYLRYLGASPPEAASLADRFIADRDPSQPLSNAPEDPLRRKVRTGILSSLQEKGRPPPFKSLEQAEQDWLLFAGPDGGEGRLVQLREALGNLEVAAARTIEFRYRRRCSRAQITRRLGLADGEINPLLRGAEATLRAILFPGAVDEERSGRERILDLALREVLYENPEPFPEVRSAEKPTKRPTVGRLAPPNDASPLKTTSDPFANDPFEDPLAVSSADADLGGVAGPDPFAKSKGPRRFPQIAHYRIDGVIAKGNMGVVYRGTDDNLGRSVAIKMMLADRETDPGLRLRFQNEGTALARLNHPNIVRVHDCGEHEGSPYIVMALIEGESLQDWLDREGKLSNRDTAKLGRALADALIHVHRNDVLHRDIKPLNVLIDKDQRPLLTDFGLAKDMGKNPHITSIGIGTPGYWPPEQAFRNVGPLGPHSDIYGLGATLYALLTGQPPYGIGSTGQILTRMKNPLPTPSELREGIDPIDPGLEAIVLRSLQRNPTDRYKTAGELRAALDLYLRNPTGVPLGAPQPRNGDPKEASPWVLAGILAVVGTVLVAALLWWGLR